MGNSGFRFQNTTAILDKLNSKRFIRLGGNRGNAVAQICRNKLLTAIQGKPTLSKPLKTPESKVYLYQKKVVKMEKIRFFIKANEKNIVTEKGVRAFILGKILNNPAFSKGAVINVDEKTVEVRLEGEESAIKDFLTNVKKEFFEKFENPLIKFSKTEKIDFEIPDLMRTSQALIVGQLEKGITVQLEILQTLKQLPTALAEKINQKI